VADEPVVVIKFLPMKAGNSLEEKTGMTKCESFWVLYSSKDLQQCEGAKLIWKLKSCFDEQFAEHELLDGAESFAHGTDGSLILYALTVRQSIYVKLVYIAFVDRKYQRI
jgi:hypothetical protein